MHLVFFLTLMLRSTFLFLHGIGEATEQRLWDEGIDTWQTFLARDFVPGISMARKTQYDEEIRTAIHQFESCNSRYFAKCLKARDHWRLFPTFRSKTAYLDIETTGDPADRGEVTLVGIYGGGKMTTLIQGDSLTEPRLKKELEKYDLLVTFFGSGFDLPYLRLHYPSVTYDHPHFDLCLAARRLGFKGGLKSIEHQLDLSRSSRLDGLTGWDAVLLWRSWQSGDTEAGTILLQYNEADTKNLEPLAEILYEGLVRHSGFRNRSPRSNKEACY